MGVEALEFFCELLGHGGELERIRSLLIGSHALEAYCHRLQLHGKVEVEFSLQLSNLVVEKEVDFIASSQGLLLILLGGERFDGERVAGRREEQTQNGLRHGLLTLSAQIVGSSPRAFNTLDVVGVRPNAWMAATATLTGTMDALLTRALPSTGHKGR